MGHYVKDSWSPSIIAILHWDGKLMESLDNKNIREERLPILLSGICLNRLCM